MKSERKSRYLEGPSFFVFNYNCAYPPTCLQCPPVINKLLEIERQFFFLKGSFPL